MKAIVQSAYGSSAALALAEIDRPVPARDEVLVRVRAASIHAGDYFMLMGSPYVARFTAGWPKPKGYVPGYDVAGVVEQVGEAVTRFRPGDAVFGECGGGGCAEFACAHEDRFAPKPDGLSFEQAAAVPVSALAALQGLRDAGKLTAGQKVLINGASGGVGTYAVQIAKSMGAEVTGVCSTANVDLVRSLGADHVIDYTQQDFTEGGPVYDLILDNIGNHPLGKARRALAPGGLLLPNTGHAGIGYILKAALVSLFVRTQGRPYLSTPNADDLLVLHDLIVAGKLRPVIDRTFPLERTPEAFDYLGTVHARGKIVITVAEDTSAEGGSGAVSL